MCSPMSANAMISSRFAAISCGGRPSSAAARSMFARPVYSGWKPDPSSSSAPTRPLTRDRAARGLDHAGDDLQQRRLAGAVLADHAERFAALQLEARRRRARGTRAPRRVPAQQVPDEAQRGRRASRPSRSPCRRRRAQQRRCRASRPLTRSPRSAATAAGTPSARRRRTARARRRARPRRPTRARGGRRAARRAAAPTSQPNGLAATHGRSAPGTSVSG